MDLSAFSVPFSILSAGPKEQQFPWAVKRTLHVISSWAAHKKGCTNCTLTESDSPTSKVSLTKWTTPGQCAHHHTDWMRGRCPSKRQRGQLLCRQHMFLLCWKRTTPKIMLHLQNSEVCSKYAWMLKAMTVPEKPLLSTKDVCGALLELN